MNILEKVINVSNILLELDTFENEISDKLSYYDSKVSDLYHFLENMPLNSKQCYRFCKELKLILNERRKYKQNLAIFQKFKTNRQKLISDKSNRSILISNLHKEYKNLNLPYKNRIYTEEELNEKIGV